MNDGGLQARIGYTFRDADLLALALTHPTWHNEHPGLGAGDNQRLEFLGDAVLGLLVAEDLYAHRQGGTPGDLTPARALRCRTEAVAARARALELGSHLRLGEGEDRQGGRNKEKVLADAWEALLGAIYLDGGLEAARTFLVGTPDGTVLGADAARFGGRDPKSALQEWCQARGSSLPRYHHLRLGGPDNAPLFRSVVSWNGEDLGAAEGKGKKSADQDAALAAIATLTQRGHWPGGDDGPST